jgi:D-sedoheptulose 7-phosphate isomerase
MNKEQFLEDYFSEFHEVVDADDIHSQLISLKEVMLTTKENSGKVVFAGNGASASIASHFALDFTKQGKIRSIAFNDASFITAYGNDYGYEHWVSKAVSHHCEPQDLAILISSSGKSPNLVNAAEVARSIGMKVVTLTGFANDNPLKLRGDINLWAKCEAYNIIESAHAFWLAAACDLLIGNSIYSVS